MGTTFLSSPKDWVGWESRFLDRVEMAGLGKYIRSQDRVPWLWLPSSVTRSNTIFKQVAGSQIPATVRQVTPAAGRASIFADWEVSELAEEVRRQQKNDYRKLASWMRKTICPFYRLLCPWGEALDQWYDRLCERFEPMERRNVIMAYGVHLENVPESVKELIEWIEEWRMMIDRAICGNIDEIQNPAFWHDDICRFVRDVPLLQDVGVTLFYDAADIMSGKTTHVDIATRFIGYLGYIASRDEQNSPPPRPSPSPPPRQAARRRRNKARRRDRRRNRGRRTAGSTE